jgi:hypothetical protein
MHAHNRRGERIGVSAGRDEKAQRQGNQGYAGDVVAEVMRHTMRLDERARAFHVSRGAKA